MTFMKHNSCNTSSIPLPLIFVCRKRELEGVRTLIEGSYSPDLECVEIILILHYYDKSLTSILFAI